MRQSSLAFRFGSLCVVAWLFARPIFGQERFGSLDGTVFDETGAVLPGVTVTLIPTSAGRSVTSSTRAEGSYSFRDIEPGRYLVRFALPRFAPVEFPDIDIRVGQRLELNATMTVGPVTATVRVLDAAPLMDMINALVAHSVSEDEFERLPKSRTFQYFAITTPGVNAGELEGGIQVNGASGAENAFVIDGVPTNSGIDGRSRQDAAFEYIQELQVKTAGIDAQYGGALGGVVSAITKSGGDSFHGAGWFYYSGSSLAADPVQRLVFDDPAGKRSVTYQQDREDRTSQFEPGFSLSGPLRRGKLYFFTAWSPAWTRRDATFAFNSGSETGVISRDRTFWGGFNKISFTPHPRIRGSVGWLWTPTKSKGTLPAYNGACPNCLNTTAASNAVNLNRGYFAPQSSYTGNVDLIASSKVVISSRGGYFWDNYKDTGVPETTSVQYQVDLPAGFLSLVPSALVGKKGFQNTPAILKHRQDILARTYGEIGANISAGPHDIRAGYEVQKTVNNVDAYYPGGYVSLWWDTSFTSLVTQRADRGTYGYYEVNDFRKLGSTGALTKSLFFQDQWRVNDRFTVSAGARLERERVPSFRRDIRAAAFDFPWSGKIAPRMGASLDLYGDGKLRLSGSWGRFYDWTKLDLARRVFGGEIWKTYYRSLDTLDVFSLGLSNLPGRNLWNPSVAGAFRDQRSAAAGLNSLDPDLKQMSQDQWSAGVDYRWNTGTVIGTRYIHQSLRRTIEDLAVIVRGNAAYIYANPGEGIAATAPFTTGRTALPLPYPKPVRKYDAVELTLNKRFSNRWFGNASYTWSRLYGNYSGIASSDEIRTPTTDTGYATSQQPNVSTANPASNANRGWDLDEILFDSKGNFDPRGRLATDRPHVFKLNGGYELRSGRLGTTNFGGFFYLASGTPLSTLVNTLTHIPVFVNGRGDMGRTPWLNYTDLQIAHSFTDIEGHTLRVELNMLNAFNQKTARHRFDNLNRGAGSFVDSSAINLRNTDLRAGYDYNALIRASTDGANAFDPRYGKDDLFTDGFAARLGVKWSF